MAPGRAGNARSDHRAPPRRPLMGEGCRQAQRHTGHRTRTGGQWTRQGAHQVHQAREREHGAAALPGSGAPVDQGTRHVQRHHRDQGGFGNENRVTGGPVVGRAVARFPGGRPSSGLTLVKCSVNVGNQEA